MVEVADLGKKYGAQWLFRHVTLSLEQGDVLGVLGNNGAGKSTFLKTLAGLVPANEGTIRLPEGPAQTSVGYAALDMNLYPQLTVTEHLEFAGRLRGIDPRAAELLDRVGLSNAATKLGSQLSTGMKTRLKLALAIQASPKLLILDEPSAGLDADGLELVRTIVEEQCDRGVVVLATNDQAERRYATHEIRFGD